MDETLGKEMNETLGKEMAAVWASLESAQVVGGMYIVDDSDSRHISCMKSNPLTGYCSCPPGFKDQQVSEGVSWAGCSGPHQYCGAHMCFHDVNHGRVAVAAKRWRRVLSSSESRRLHESWVFHEWVATPRQLSAPGARR